MKKLALALILGLTFSKVSAQESESQALQFPLAATCDVTEDIQEFIKGYGEKPFAQIDVLVAAMNGNDYTGKMTIWVNPKTQSTTVTIEFAEDDMTCIVALGENFGPAFTGKSI